MNPARAVIFDMDGVIVNSEPRHEGAFLEVVAEIGYGGKHGMRFADYIGLSDQRLWQDFVTKNNPTQTLQELVAMKRQRVVEIIRREQPLFEGVSELIKKMAPKYRLALASGSERAIVDEVLNLDGLRQFFPVTVSASEITRGKPAPDIFLRAAELLGVAREACWVIEDSKHGITAARAAGMRVIGITNTYPAEELGKADYVVGSYDEIERLLLAGTGRT